MFCYTYNILPYSATPAIFYYIWHIAVILLYITICCSAIFCYTYNALLYSATLIILPSAVLLYSATPAIFCCIRHITMILPYIAICRSAIFCYTCNALL